MLKSCEYCSTSVSEFTGTCPRCDMPFPDICEGSRLKIIKKRYMQWSRKSRSYLIQLLLQSMLTPSFWIGFFFATLTLFSIVVNISSIDLNGSIELLWRKYLEYRDWVFSPITDLLRINLPSILKDLISFYFFMGFTNLRAYQMALETFDIHSTQERPSWLPLVIIWPRTAVAYIRNWISSGIIRNPVHQAENKMGYNDDAAGVNVFLGHAKFIPTLIIVQIFVVSLGIIWGLATH